MIATKACFPSGSLPFHKETKLCVRPSMRRVTTRRGGSPSASRIESIIYCSMVVTLMMSYCQYKVVNYITSILLL